ncbi:MAG: uracil-DNA glycosylase family protein [Candidatus Woesearchaeota archaeon]
MTLKEIYTRYDKLQLKYGETTLKAIYGGGLEENPDTLFIFMNPTATNLASHSNWQGINAPFIGTKSVWKVLFDLDLISNELLTEILDKKPRDWTECFADKVYNEIKSNKIYITNLAKCTQLDARKLKDDIFKKYLSLLEEEITLINPKKIVCFGNKVSSLFLNKKIEVGKNRCVKHYKTINNNSYITYACYYPIGLGFRNRHKALEDLDTILKKE